MGDAWINGRAAALDAATAEAARLLSASRMPVIAGLGADIAGARAAIALAERLGGVVDHMHSSAVLRDLAVMREAGLMVTTASEARLRADVLLLVGPGLTAAPVHWPQRLFTPVSGAQADHGLRRIVWLCPGRVRPPAPNVPVDVLGGDADELAGLLAALRARVASRPLGDLRVPAKSLDEAVATLKAAQFGVAVWSASGLDPLTIEMLFGLLNDLNAATRFSGLPLTLSDNAAGVLECCGWMTGFPMRTGFARGYPEHDPWRFDSTRLVDSGEADCALWISAYRAVQPTWKRRLPTIALMAADVTFRPPPRVRISVGAPGVDHDGVEHIDEFGVLGMVKARETSRAPSVAHVLARIAAALPESGAWPC
jgi:formylmethanofuran dehydrogenase subunit B